MKELPVKIWGIVSRFNKITWKIEYLLLKRTHQDWWFWQCITGTLHQGESFVECLQREMNEEAGITQSQILDISDLIDTFTRNKKDGQLIHEFVYSVVIDGEWFDVTLSPEEHDEYLRADYPLALKTLEIENNRHSLILVQNQRW